MTKFAKKKITCIVSEKPIFQLIENNKAVIDEFESSIESNAIYRSEFKSMIRIMEGFADGKLLPQNKFKFLKANKRKDIKEFEFKSRNLRIYGIILHDGKIVLASGFKNSQKKDIPSFQALKIRYIEFLKL